MLKITVLVVGKLREDYWKEAEREFLKRLTPYAKLQIIEVESTPVSDAADAERSMKAEGERLLARVPDASYIVALERTGKRLSSEDFAKILGREANGGGHVVLVIGGAAGLSTEVLSAAKMKISLSDMTFTHEMARVFVM